MTPLISVIVPAHNMGAYLKDTLNGVQQQTESRWECLVIDDGSTDETSAVARQFERSDSRFRLVSQENAGVSAARNTGFRSSNADSQYVIFMDADDVWVPTALERMLAEMRPGRIGSHALAELIDAQGAPLRPGTYSDRGRRRRGLVGRRFELYSVDQPTDFNVLINGNVLFPPGLALIRRDAYALAGPFDEALTGAEDWDMLIRLSRQGPISFIDEVLLYYRRHGANLGAASSIPEQAWRVRCLNFFSDENSSEQSRLARKGWRASQLHLLSVDLRGESSDDLELSRRRGGWAFRAACVLRYVRGCPLPRVRRDPLSW